NRLVRLRENLGRLSLEAEIVASDMMTYEPSQPFDAVLLDAPCSSTGTVRRHPDVPWVKGPEDIARLAGVQRRLLERAIELVRPGGLIVFSNCSLDPAEGEELVSALLAARTDVERLPIRPGEVPGADPFIDA